MRLTANHLSRAKRRFALLATTALLAGLAGAAPYPEDGLPVEWKQPDGTTLRLRVFGDEFYARTETEDGRTVVFDPDRQAYFYAELSADRTALVSTGEMVENTGSAPVADPIVGREESVRLPPERIAEIHEQNREKLVPDEIEKWEAKKEATRQSSAEATDLEAQEAKAAPAEGEPAASAVTGGYIGLTILVQFPDDPATGTSDPTTFPTTRTKVERYCNEIGYTDDGNTGSVRDYFRDQSMDILDYTQQVTEIVTLPQPRNYYNFSDYPTNSTLRNAGNSGRLVLADAVTILQGQGFDFSSLTIDGPTREIVATNILYAGPTSGVWPMGLWPHRSSISYINVGTAQNPRYIHDYQITNAASSSITIGTFCHENGHLLLKLPDLYDTDGGSEGVGRHCLMGSANHLNGGRTPGPINAYFRDTCGWMSVTDLTPASFLRTTLGSNTYEAVRIRKPGTATEYFIVENRGTGDRWATYSPDKGILIWHVDETVNGNRREEMTPTQHYEVSVEQADGDFDLEMEINRGDSGDLFDNISNLFHDTTLPDSKWWDGSNSGIRVEVLSPASSSMDVIFGTQPPNTITFSSPPSNTVLVAGQRLDIGWNGTFAGNVRIELHKGGAFFSLIAASVPNTGLYQWSSGIQLASGDYSIRISSVDTPTIEATSSVFEIIQSIFWDDFESGSFSSLWEITGTGTHRTIITTGFEPYAGSRHLTMDSSSSNYARNELTLTLDLSSATGVVLEFYAKDFGDETNGPPTAPFVGGADFDGVAVSADGNLWYEVQPLRNEITGSWQRFTVDLDNAAAARGLTYNETFRIRFNHYDNLAISTDGFAFDNIGVFGTVESSVNSTLDLSIATDTGISNSDGLTREKRPVFQGNTEPGTEVTVVSNLDGDLGAQVADSNGDWSVTPGFNLRDGVHLISTAGDVVSPSLLVEIDSVPPESILDRAPGQADPATSGPAVFRVSFDEPVTGFTSGDLSVSGSAAGSAGVSSGPSTYTVTVAATSAEGTVTLGFGAGAAQDHAGNPSAAPDVVDGDVTLDGHRNTSSEATFLAVANSTGTEAGWLSAGDHDVFAFTLAASAMVEVYTTGTVDTVGTLVDGSAVVVNDPESDDDAGAGENFSTTLYLVAGTYYIQLESADGTPDGDYGLVLELSPPPVLINEVDALTFENDSREFIELFDGGIGNVPLDDHVLVLIDGASGNVYRAIGLDGHTTDGDGFFAVGSAAVPGVSLAVPNGTLQNGYDAVSLFSGEATDFPVGSPPGMQGLIDAVVYKSSAVPDGGELAPLLRPGEEDGEEHAHGFAPGQSLQRMPDGQGGPRVSSATVTAAGTPAGPNGYPGPPATLDLPDGSDTGDSATDDLTRLSRPSLRGTATPGSLVELVSNRNGSVGIAQTGSDGVFTLAETTVALAEGAHTISASTVSTGEAGPELAILLDLTPPQPVVSLAPGQSDPGGLGPISFAVTFGESVAGFDSSDVVVSGGPAGIPGITGGGAVYTVSLDPGSEGRFTISVLPDSAADAAGNGNLTSSGTAGVTVDTIGSGLEGAAPVELVEGLGSRDGWLAHGDLDAFRITLTHPRILIVQTQGGLDTIADIFDANGQSLVTPARDDNSGSDKNFRIEIALAAGEYVIEINNKYQPAEGAYTILFDANGIPDIQPDLSIGTPSEGKIGDDIFGDSTGQVKTLTSFRGGPVSARINLENDGEFHDTFTVSASKGNHVFPVNYTTWKDGNITAALLAGTHTEEAVPPGDESPTILAIVKPNIKYLRKIKRKKKKGRVRRKIVWLRQSANLNISAVSESAEVRTDSVRVNIQSR